MTHTKRTATLITIIALSAFATAAYAVSPVLKQMEDGFVALHDDLSPIVVNIDTKVSAPENEAGAMEGPDELFRFFGLPYQGPDHNMQGPKFRRPPRMAQGSGFIYDKEGHIITNNHVVEGVEKITVKFSDGTKQEATVVGTDRQTDIAVIKVDPRPNMRYAKLGDSDKLKVGQFAIAVGSARGLEETFSYGHISALGRQLDLPGLRFQNFIQTDAAINLGNSGGPLCNLDGQVIGINVAIVYGANSLGFAIPINTAKDIVPSLIGKHKVTRGYLGVKVQNADLFAESEQLAIPDKKGALVTSVMKDSPAGKAEIKPYDVIRKVNGQPVENAADLVKKISALEPNTATKIEVWRDKTSIEVTVTLDEFTEEAVGETQPGGSSKQSVLGIHVDNLSSDLAQRMGLESDTTGVVIVDIEPGSPAEDAGLTPRHIITDVEKEKVANVDDFLKVMKEKALPGKQILIGVIRPGGEHNIVMFRVPEDAKPK